MKDTALRVLDTLNDVRGNKRARRLTDLLRDPQKDYTDDWFMCVPKCFNDALDIRKSERVIGNKKTLSWTQGWRFSFRIGHTLYDTPKAYAQWSKAIADINHCVQVKEAAEATTTDEGIVKIDMLVQNEDRTKLVVDKEMTFTQNEFVRFLICGESEGPSNRQLNLLETQ